MSDKISPTPFYARFVELCRENNLSPAAAAKSAGISSGAPTAWKHKNSIPKLEQRQKLCQLFGVTDNDLMGYDKQKKPVNTEVDGQMVEAIDLICRMTPANRHMILAQLRAVVDAQENTEPEVHQAD